MLLGMAPIKGQNPKMTFPNKAYNVTPPIVFNLPVPGGFNYSGVSAMFSHNSMIDNTPFQNIKFFIVDNKVYDASGNAFTNGLLFHPNGGPEVNGSSETCIVPDPGNCTKYYIFSATPEFGNTEAWFPTYSIVDVATNSVTMFGSSNSVDLRTLIVAPPGLGYGESGDGIASNATRPTIAASKPLANGNYMVFVYDGIRHVYRFLVAPTGVTYAGFVLDLSYPGGGYTFSGQLQRAELEIIEKPLPGGGYRLAGAGILHQTGAVEIIPPLPTVFTVELNNLGVVVPGTAKYYFYTPYVFFNGLYYEAISPFIHGLEFSPNANFLYVSHEKVGNGSSGVNPIDYFDCTTAGFSPSLTPIAAATVTEPFQYSQLEYGIDGKIYETDGLTLSTINTPNNPAITTFTPNAVVIPGGYNYTDELSSVTTLKTFILPDQIDGLNYTNQFQGLQCCIDGNPYDQFSFTANAADVTWVAGSNPLVGAGSIAYIRDEIIIPQDLIVTITNMQLYFAPGARILIERGTPGHKGGILILNNTILSVDNRCGTNLMWNGVEVEGYSNLTQIPLTNTRQAQLRTNTNTKIEHAYVGVAASKFTAFDPSTQTFIQDATTGGGIIRMNNSTVENCFVDLWFSDFTFSPSNTSKIVNCRLQTTNLLNDPAYTPGTHAFIVNNDGINFQGNDFKNTNPGLFTQDTRGFGIYAVNSKVFVTQTIIPFDPNNFENLWYGIIGFPTLGLKPINCVKTNFTNCFHGIFLSASHFSTITSNTFSIPEDPGFSASDKPYGLLMTGCTGYKVEANYFHSQPAPSLNWGVIVDNSGALNNVIYRNTFENLFIGGQSQGINGIAPSPFLKNTGLRWKCNTFLNDIERADLAYASGRIAQFQGTCALDPAANKFSQNNFVTYSDHDFAANTPAVLTNPVYYTQWPSFPERINDYNTSVFITLAGCGSTSPGCPSSLGPFGIADIGTFDNTMDVADNEINNLLSIIDGGNKSALLNAMNTNSNGNLKNLLLSKSPYLSDEVLISYINRSSTPHGHLKDVVIANSPVSADVYEAIDSKNLPNGIKNQINAAQVGTSPRQILEGEVDLKFASKSLAMDEIIRIYLNDTIIQDPIDSVIEILEQEIVGNPYLKEILTLAYLQKGNGTKALQIKEELEVELGQNNFSKYVDVALTIGSSCNIKPALCTNASLLDDVEEIAYDALDGKNACYGKNMLYQAHQTFIPVIIEELLSLENRNMQITTPSNTVEEEIVIYPNPTTDILNVQLPAEWNTDNMTVYLSNFIGQQIMYKEVEGNLTFTFDLQTLESGIYLLTVVENGILLATKKIIVQ